MKLRSRESGIIIIMAAVSMFVLLAFVGIALDAGFLYFQKRRMQTAADAGAYAGALEKVRGNSNTAATSAAKNDSSINGFTDQTNGVTVTVNIPPASGPKAGDSNFVEVIVQQLQPTWFMRAVNFNSANVAARAVAGIGNTGNGCVYALNPNLGNNNGFFVNGTTNSSFSCGVFSNSNFRATGSGCVVTPSVSYTGTYDNHNSTSGCGPTGVSPGVPVVDPLLNKYSPPYSHSVSATCDYTNYKVTGGTVTLNPGVYCGGIDLGGSTVSANFTAGSYVLMGGGMKITSSVNITGTGVTFFNTYPGSQTNKYNGISINGSGTVNFTAPTTGAYKGLLFYQDPTVSWAANNGSIITGGSGSVYDGILYFPTTDLTYGGNSSSDANGTDGYTLLVAYNITVNGTAHVNTDFSAIGGTNPFQDAVFAE